MRRLHLWCAILLLGLAFYLRVHELTEYPPGVNFDESVEIVDAGLILQAREVQMVYYGDERSEGLSRIILALSTLFIGQSIFAYRLTNALLSLLAIAAAGGAAREMFAARSKWVGDLALLTAISTLTVNQSFLTLSRAMYRGISTVLFTALFLLLFWKATHWVLSGRVAPRSRRALLLFALAGLCLGVIPQTYTAGLFGAGLAGVLVAHLFIFHGRRWRQWLPGTLLLLLIFGVLFAPTLYLIQTNPDRVIGRARIVSGGASITEPAEFQRRFDLIRSQFTISGDANPQYNSNLVPLLMPHTYWLFYIGIGVCLLLLFRLPLAMALALLLLSIFPVMLSNEIPHGLRIVMVFAALPLIYAAAVGQIMLWLERFKVVRWGVALFAIALLVYIPTQANRISAEYRDYYTNKERYSWAIWDERLSNAEWFFLPQYRYMAQYITDQPAPLYLAIGDAGNPILRSQLLQQYPRTRTWVDLPVDLADLPAGHLLAVDDIQNTPTGRIVPDFEVLVYVPADGDTLYLLPPLTDAAAQAVRETVITGDTLTHPDHAFPIGYASQTDVTPLFEFAPIHASTGVTFGERIQVAGYTGSQVITPGQPHTYCLIWTATRNMARNQQARVQIWSHDNQGVVSTETPLLRWLYPTMLWRAGDRVPDCYQLTLPPASPPGLYRLMAGVYERNFPMLAAADPAGNPLYEIAMVGALKIPAPPVTETPDYELDATLRLPGDQQITLLGYNGNRPEAGNPLDLTLFWQAQGVPPQAYTIFIHVIDATGTLIAQQDVEPWQGRYPTLIWSEGEIVKTEHRLDIPADAQSPVLVYTGMYSPLDFQRLPAMQDGQAISENRLLLNFE